MDNIVKINDRFAIATFAPDAQSLRQFAAEGYQSIVNMRTDDEKQALHPDEEGELAEEAKLTYLHYPVAGDSLSDEMVDGFRRKVGELPAPILVHCASGKRSGALLLMHLASKQGMSGEEVIEQAHSLGFKCDTPELESFVKSYVDRHNS